VPAPFDDALVGDFFGCALLELLARDEPFELLLALFARDEAFELFELLGLFDLDDPFDFAELDFDDCDRRVEGNGQVD